MRIHDERTFDRVFREGSLGLGEAYMDGWWDCDQLDGFFYRVLRYGLDKKFFSIWPYLLQTAMSLVFNQQSGKRAFEVGERHYDTGNDLFQPMLGRSMAYSCGYWSSPFGEAKNLDEAQEAKFDLICRKLGLKPGMTFLDIGCGWGSLVKYAVQKYRVKATGITVSEKQAEFAKDFCKELPVPVEIKFMDYRCLDRKFDRIASVGMIEHVGYRNYREYMRTACRSLNDGGLFLLHTIGSDTSVTSTDPWIEKYIFPNSHLPSLKQLMAAAEGMFVTEDLHNFGADYDKTLMAWHDNFEKAWPRLKGDYSERFRRMWRYYLLSCAGMFRARKGQLWQIVFSKNGVPGGWSPVR
jgi:cyclopropane-fatty-acyl-phospholipid synthase